MRLRRDGDRILPRDDPAARRLGGPQRAAFLVPLVDPQGATPVPASLGVGEADFQVLRVVDVRVAPAVVPIRQVADLLVGPARVHLLADPLHEPGHVLVGPPVLHRLLAGGAGAGQRSVERRDGEHVAVHPGDAEAAPGVLRQGALAAVPHGFRAGHEELERVLGAVAEHAGVPAALLIRPGAEVRKALHERVVFPQLPGLVAVDLVGPAVSGPQAGQQQGQVDRGDSLRHGRGAGPRQRVATFAGPRHPQFLFELFPRVVLPPAKHGRVGVMGRRNDQGTRPLVAGGCFPALRLRRQGFGGRQAAPPDVDRPVPPHADQPLHEVGDGPGGAVVPRIPGGPRLQWTGAADQIDAVGCGLDRESLDRQFRGVDALGQRFLAGPDDDGQPVRGRRCQDHAHLRPGRQFDHRDQFLDEGLQVLAGLVLDHVDRGVRPAVFGEHERRVLRGHRRRDGGKILDIEVLLSGGAPLGPAALDDRPREQRDDPGRIHDKTLHGRRWLLEVWGLRRFENSPAYGKLVGRGRWHKSWLADLPSRCGVCCRPRGAGRHERFVAPRSNPLCRPSHASWPSSPRLSAARP